MREHLGLPKRTAWGWVGEDGDGRNMGSVIGHAEAGCGDLHDAPAAFASRPANVEMRDYREGRPGDSGAVIGSGEAG